MRSYLPANHADKHREIGSEPSPEAFVETMVEVFREVRRVMRPDATLWLNLGDSYAGSQQGIGADGKAYAGPKQATNTGSVGIQNKPRKATEIGLKPKDLVGIPWRVALALQADGWWLRSVICWHKKSCMPESVTDRPTNSWEPIFLLAKSAKYFYDAEAVKEPLSDSSIGRLSQDIENQIGTTRANGGMKTNGNLKAAGDLESGTRNQRNVWSLGPEPYAEAHFATFPTEIPRRAILAGTSAKGCCPKCFSPWVRVVEKSKYVPPTGKRNVDESRGDKTRKLSGADYNEQAETRTLGWAPGCECNAGEPNPCTVLDPFAGSGTSGLVALQLGREFIGCELNQDYIELAGRRMFPASAPLFDDMPQMEILTP